MTKAVARPLFFGHGRKENNFFHSVFSTRTYPTTFISDIVENRTPGLVWLEAGKSKEYDFSLERSPKHARYLRRTRIRWGW